MLNFQFHHFTETGTISPGAVLHFYGHDTQSKAIRFWTRGPSHSALVYTIDAVAGPLLVESTTTYPLPCLLHGIAVSGVQVHPVEKRIGMYPGDVEVQPLAPMWRLDSSERDLLKSQVEKYWIKQPYDLGGALLSGSKLLKFFNWYPYPDDASVFCSSLCFQLLARLHRLPMDYPDKYNPGRLRRTCRRVAAFERPIPVKHGGLPC